VTTTGLKRRDGPGDIPRGLRMKTTKRGEKTATMAITMVDGEGTRAKAEMKTTTNIRTDSDTRVQMITTAWEEGELPRPPRQ